MRTYRSGHNVYNNRSAVIIPYFDRIQNYFPKRSFSVIMSVQKDKDSCEFHEIN